jgi:DNA-binding GntR family transcriptional regulator
VRDQTVVLLRTAIVECRFEPGGRLVERELCELLGVSRSSVREALRQLEAEGLVTIIPHAGPVVCKPKPEEVAQIYEYRAVLEGMAARWFCGRASRLNVKHLSRTVERIEAASRSLDLPALHAAKTQFYEVLAIGCRNGPLSGDLARLRARVTLLRDDSLSRPDAAIESAGEIALIMRAIEERDADRAQALAVKHIRASAERAARFAAIEG